MIIPGARWFQVKDGDPRAFALMREHYSFRPYADGRRQNLSNSKRHLFVGPGQKMVLLTWDCTALFVWRHFIDKSNQVGVNCAVFRNTSRWQSSDLILEAEGIAAQRWPGERLYTYVNHDRIQSVNPGYCFQRAGWEFLRAMDGKPARTATRGLYILEKYG